MKKKEKLEKNKKDRLEKLCKEWEKSEQEVDFLSSFKNIDVLDLRLLLENPSPVQELIKAIAISVLRSTSPSERSEEIIGLKNIENSEEYCKDSQDKNRLLEETRRQLEKANIELSKEQIALASIKGELVQAQAAQAAQNRDMEQLRKAAKEIEADLKACAAQVEKLLKKEEGYKQDIKALKDERKQLQVALTAAQACNQAAPAVTFLRNDYALAQAMGLDDLPLDDTQALIQTVAVLAQLDNVQRLWHALKERCELGKRPATVDESALLETALNWHNHTWRSQPYRLIEVNPGSRYDYENQARISHVTKGETVVTLFLYGISNSQGQPLCKAIVSTQ